MIVLDASVWVGSLFSDETHHAVSLAWRDTYLDVGDGITVPTLFLAEVGGSIVRRSRNTEQARRNVGRIQSDGRFTIVETDPLIDLVVDTAVTASLRGADAVYVALARHLELPLVTWDREVVRKAGTLIDVREPALTGA